MNARIVVKDTENGTEVKFKGAPKYEEVIYVLKMLGLDEKYAENVFDIIDMLSNKSAPKVRITNDSVVIWKGSKHTIYMDRDIKDKEELRLAVKEYIPIIPVAETSHFEFNKPRKSYVEFISNGIHFTYDILPEKNIIADIENKKVKIEIYGCYPDVLEKVANLVQRFGVVDKIVFDRRFERNTLIDNNGELILLARCGNY